ncbi:hypothetical protein PS1_010076 [Malus domestica]
MARACRYEHILPISVAMVDVLPDIPYKEGHVTQMVFLDKIAKEANLVEGPVVPADDPDANTVEEGPIIPADVPKANVVVELYVVPADGLKEIPVEGLVVPANGPEQTLLRRGSC